MGAIASWPGRSDLVARLVDRDRTLIARGTRRLARMGLARVEFVPGDAGRTTCLEGAVPADLVLLCGIFGNVSDADVRRTVQHAPELCAPGALVIWTRGRFAPDLTPSIREWFARAGFDEVAFVSIPGSTASVGAHRLSASPRPYRRGVRLFRFLPAGARPSDRARSLRTGNKRAVSPPKKDTPRASIGEP